MLQLMVLVTAGYSDTFLSFTTLLAVYTFKFLLCQQICWQPCGANDSVTQLVSLHERNVRELNLLQDKCGYCQCCHKQNCEERVRRMTVNKKEKVVSLLVKAWCLSMLAVCLITWVKEGWNAVTLQLLDCKQFTKTSDH